MKNERGYLVPFALVCTLFFMWGVANSLNGSLIRHFQFALDLKRWQAGIVDSAFYFGYFVMAIPAGIFMRRWGYKKGILAGLALYAAGAALFFPAADWRVYGFFLFALFTIASGLAFLETAANLYVTVLGDEKGAAWRINFAQSFNGMSLILGPIIGSLFIFSKKEYDAAALKMMSPAQIEAARVAEALSVQGTYLAVAAIVGALALLFWAVKMPEIGRDEEQTGQKIGFFDLLKKYPQLALGVAAQFANVGAQATLWGYFVDFKMDLAPTQHLAPAAAWADFVRSLVGETGELTAEKMAGFHASFAMGLFMLGRFVGTFLMSKFEGRRVLTWYSAGAVALVAGAFLTSGATAIACLMGTYFCQSVMFPTVFALSTRGLSPSEGKLASSLVIMSIVGGAVLPPLAGLLSVSGGMKTALFVPFSCFLFVVFYAVRGSKKGGGAVAV